jgi:hypothetical protein
MRRTNRTVLETHNMRWEPLIEEGSTGKAWIKTLSKDDETGGRTALIKFDPGYKRERKTSGLPMDMYVLEGSMQCGDLTFNKDTFYYRPGNVEYGPINSPEGCVRWVATVDKHLKSPTEPVYIEDVKQLPWGADRFDLTATARGRKTLRLDPESRIVIRYHETWEAGSRGVPGLQQVHDYGEEYFVIEGAFWDYLEEVDGHILNVAGSYGCRRPFESSHGDTLTIQMHTRLIFRGDYSTSEEPMGIEEAVAKSKEKGLAPGSETAQRPVELLKFAE